MKKVYLNGKLFKKNVWEGKIDYKFFFFFFENKIDYKLTCDIVPWFGLWDFKIDFVYLRKNYSLALQTISRFGSSLPNYKQLDSSPQTTN
jgi:hypothetical protein